MKKNDMKQQKTDAESRRLELIALVAGDGVTDDVRARRLVDELVFLESQMEDLRRLPLITVNPNNPAQQKTTPAAKLYKEFLQQYNNSMRLLLRLSGDLSGDDETESPLRAWLKARKDEA